MSDPSNNDIWAAGFAAGAATAQRRSTTSKIVVACLTVVVLMAAAIIIGFTHRPSNGPVNPLPSNPIHFPPVASPSTAADTPRTPTFVDMNGNPVVPYDTSVYDPTYVQEADAQPDLGERFKVPSVNLDVPLGSVNVVGGLIDPPGFTSVYWVKNMGVSLEYADEGTVYVVTHSLKSPSVAPGDYMIDQNTATVAVQKGAEIDVGDRTYTVDSSMTVSKDELGQQTDLWAGTPGMLVLITTVQAGQYLPNGQSVTNVIIIGTLVS